MLLETNYLLQLFGLKLIKGGKFKPEDLEFNDNYPSPEIVKVSMEELVLVKPLFLPNAWKKLLKAGIYFALTL